MECGYYKKDISFRHVKSTLIVILLLLLGCLSDSDNSSEDVMMPPPAVNPSPSPTVAPQPTPTFEPVPSPTPEPEPGPSPVPTIEPTPTIIPSPQPTPTPDDSLSDFAQTMLDLVNEARSQSRFCGDEFKDATTPLMWDERLERAATNHSIDMADHENFSHEGTDGSLPWDRATREGYHHQIIGENILVGNVTEQEAVEIWLDSPPHCRLMMDERFEDLGVGVAEGFFRGNLSLYWTMVLGSE